MKDVENNRALKTIGELLSANHPMEIMQNRPAGWRSWRCFRAGVTEDDVSKNADFISRNISDLSYIQIDDGYQEYMGDWLSVGEKFGDFPKLISQIENSGCKTAIWIAPLIAEKDSRLFREHPEYFVNDENGEPLSSGKFTFEGWRRSP